jgi:hypothetical protein
MNLQFFVCFHKKIFHNIYKITPAEKEKYITFYGVKEKDPEGNPKIIYEYELEKYNPNLQSKKYNEGSCLFHVYKNKLYNTYDYVGFCQYDMVFPQRFFKFIEAKLNSDNNSKVIFYLDFFKWAFLGGQTTIIRSYPNVPSGLKSYNLFFNKNYTANHLIKNKMIICNTFLIPKKMYEKMMAWLVHYFRNDINDNYICSRGHHFNPGHIIEALTSMFLSLEISEGAVYEKLYLRHDHDIKSKAS